MMSCLYVVFRFAARLACACDMAVGGAAGADGSGAEESSASEAKKSSSSASPVLAAIAGPGAVEGEGGASDCGSGAGRFFAEKKPAGKPDGPSFPSYGPSPLCGCGCWVTLGRLEDDPAMTSLSGRGRFARSIFSLSAFSRATEVRCCFVRRWASHCFTEEIRLGIECHREQVGVPGTAQMEQRSTPDTL